MTPDSQRQPIPGAPRSSWRRDARVWLVLLVFGALLSVLMGFALAPAGGTGQLTLLPGASDGVRLSGSPGPRLNVVVPAGEQRFQVRIEAPGSTGPHVLQTNRTGIEAVHVRQPETGMARSEYFFDPLASSSREVAAFFEFPVLLQGSGTVLEFGTRARRDHMLTMQLLPKDVARRVERRASMSTAARYGILLVLAVLLLTLHVSTGEPISLAYVWFILASIITLLVVNGHMFMLPGLGLAGHAGEDAMAAARMLLVAFGLPLALMLGHAGVPPVRLVRRVRWVAALFVLLAAVFMLGAWPQGLRHWDVVVWGGGALLGLLLTARSLGSGMPLAVGIVAALVAVYVLALWNDLADAGRVQGIWWTLRGFQMALLLLCSVVGAALMRQVRVYQWQLEAARAREAAALEESRAMRYTARTDVLTGLPNRRALDQAMAEAMARAAADELPLAVLFVDLDHFKAINDRHGHAAGDQVLRDVGQVLRGAMRAGDHLGRYGGEEFVAVLPGASLEAARTLGERLRAAVTAMRMQVDGVTVPLTVSVGVSVRRPDEHDLPALLRRADKALYQAKDRGRDRVVAIV